ncbi:uncharacterized protein LOC6732695 isoform X2 [Drosophila simulans]|uniref:uncharacterized protein LOC6732695 isoform X2 n=1 Tax=Drosophila simulans TaxID=7240 RepID=UPI00192D02E5|nr:uncharacterized protein LOC6732695 isoform X2 [Drosophila simulans]
MVSKKRKNSDENKKKVETTFESDPYEIKFPLPEQLDPSQCRDEFIGTFIREHEIRASSLRPRSTFRAASEFRSSQDLTDQGPEKGAEAMVVRQLVSQRKRLSLRKTKEEILENIKLRCTMMNDLNLKCQKAAIEFLSVRLLKQLRLFSSPWPGDTGDIPYNLFSWSMDDFLMRLSIKQVYLDVINRERSAEDLDCLKFCKDLGQIELLIHEIRDDYRNDRDLCQGSMELLRSAQYNINAPWVSTLKENLESIRSSSLTARLFAQSSAFNIVMRHSSAMGAFEDESGSD